MSVDAVREIADAVMYEGYMLYPYRPSSVKNRQRWTFGGLYPQDSQGGATGFLSQFLIACDEEPEVSVTTRFLHLLRQEHGSEEGTPREVGAGAFFFAGDARQADIQGAVELSVEQVGTGLFRGSLVVSNLTKSPDDMAQLASTHAIVRAKRGCFLSMTDPPEEFQEEAARCVNQGVWPVLAGEPGTGDCMLVSPIILYDYPRIAPESVGDLFDATEIDEILSLRIMMLTEGEKDEIRAGDARTRGLLERTEALSGDGLMKLHGVLRQYRDERLKPAPQSHGLKPVTQVRHSKSVWVSGVELKAGDLVRLRPRKSGDVFDMALAGQVAEIEAVEQDFEGRVHLAVVLADDPGKDLGAMRQPGQRFFFAPEEVEPFSQVQP
jgi:hypothetical protein